MCLLPSLVEGATHLLCPPQTGFLVGAIGVGVRGFPVRDRCRFAFRWGSCWCVKLCPHSPLELRWVPLACRQEHAEILPSASTRYTFLHLPAFIASCVDSPLPNAAYHSLMCRVSVIACRGFFWGHMIVAERGPMFFCAREWATAARTASLLAPC